MCCIETDTSYRSPHHRRGSQRLSASWRRSYTEESFSRPPCTGWLKHDSHSLHGAIDADIAHPEQLILNISPRGGGSAVLIITKRLVYRQNKTITSLQHEEGSYQWFVEGCKNLFLSCTFFGTDTTFYMPDALVCVITGQT